MTAIVPSEAHAENFDALPPLDPNPGAWFGVPVTMVVAAPTRTAAGDLAHTLEQDRLPNLTDLTVRSVRVISRNRAPHSLATSGATWLVEAVFTLKAANGDEARGDVERVCRRDAGHLHLFVAFADADELPDQERLSPACRRLIADAVDRLVFELKNDLAEIEEGTEFLDTWHLSACLPARYVSSYDVPFLKRWIATVRPTAMELLRYPYTYFSTTAEELAAHAIIAAVHAEFDIWFDDDVELMREISDQIEILNEVAFEDHDILMAFSDGPTPAENPAVIELLGIANFTPDRWFTPFRDREDG